MNKQKTLYNVHRYYDGELIGHVFLWPEQFEYYMSIAQQPQGLIKLNDPRVIEKELCKIDPEWQKSIPHNTTVYLQSVN